MPETHAARRARAQELIAAGGADAALITSLANVRYLTGLASSNAALLLPAGAPGVLATDSRYTEAATRDAPDLELVTERFIEPALARLAAARGLRTVAFEAQVMTVEQHQALTSLDGGPALVPLGRVIEELRMVKDEAEIALLARACAITDQALSDALPGIAPGRTERQLAILLERAMIDRGAEAVAFDTIVASGPNGAIPHHAPAGRPFAAGDLITIDCGARYGGYHADMTRTVALGAPAAWQREIYEIVAAAQLAGIEAATAGADVSTVDAAARGLIADTGFPLPSNPGSTCPAGAASESRTLSWCAPIGGVWGHRGLGCPQGALCPPGPAPTPGRRDHARYSPRPRRNSSFSSQDEPFRTHAGDTTQWPPPTISRTA